MDKDFAKYLTNKSSTASYLFSCCEFLRIAADKLIEMSTYEDTGLSKLELQEIQHLGMETHDLRHKVGIIAVGVSEDLEHDIKNYTPKKK